MPTRALGLAQKFQEVFGERVKARRREKGLTQLSLAELLYISRPKLANIEAGNQRTSVFLLARLSQILEIPASDLVPEIAEAENQLRQERTVTLDAATASPLLVKNLAELNLSVETNSTLQKVLKKTKSKK